MYSLLITISVIASILLVIIILMQASKGEGLAGSIAGGQVGNVFGTRRTADFLSRATWWLGGIVLVLAISINLFFLPGKTTQAQRESIIQSRNAQQQIPQQSTLPAQTETTSGQAAVDSGQ